MYKEMHSAVYKNTDDVKSSPPVDMNDRRHNQLVRHNQVLPK